MLLRRRPVGVDGGGGQGEVRRHLAEAIRRSIDTVQPASVEYAEAWSAGQAGIINIKDDDPPPAAGEVKIPARIFGGRGSVGGDVIAKIAASEVNLKEMAPMVVIVLG